MDGQAGAGKYTVCVLLWAVGCCCVLLCRCGVGGCGGLLCVVMGCCVL